LVLNSLHARLCLSILAAGLAIAPARAQDNPAARRGPADFTMLSGSWNGANLERRSNCAATQNNGSHGTYAQYYIAFGGTTLTLDEVAVTGLTCSYVGTVGGDPIRPQWNGDYSCSDGKRGTFRSSGFLITPTEMQIRLAIKLNFSETCDVDAILGGSRF
jgi:hypothetical protein